MCILSLMNFERDDSMERSTRIKADKEILTANVEKIKWFKDLFRIE